jgi:hypothetical protein
MRILKEVLAAAALVVFVASLAPAHRLTNHARRHGRYSVYNTKYKCQMVCQGNRPFLETLETGVAYALDIPLAILSPITCPIIRPVMDRIAPAPEYRRKSRR